MRPAPAIEIRLGTNWFEMPKYIAAMKNNPLIECLDGFMVLDKMRQVYLNWSDGDDLFGIVSDMWNDTAYKSLVPWRIVCITLHVL